MEVGREEPRGHVANVPRVHESDNPRSTLRSPTFGSGGPQPSVPRRVFDFGTMHKGMLELADVAGPLVGEQRTIGIGAEPLRWRSRAVRGRREEVLEEQRQVFDPLTQRRQADGHHVEAILKEHAGHPRRLRSAPVCRRRALGPANRCLVTSTSVEEAV